MSMHDTFVRYPFELFASSSQLGKSHSSTSTVTLQQVRTLNAAQTQLSVNATLGNVFIQDKQFKIEDDGVSLTVGMTWNSTNNTWRFSAQTSAQIQGVGPDNSFCITEADGRVVRYLKQDNHYLCSEPDQHGLSIVSFENNLCTRFFPDTGVTEVFNASGNLEKQILPTGMMIEYLYENNQLTSILLPSQRQIIIDRQQASNIKLNLINPDETITPICTYQQDESGSLTTTIAQPDGKTYQTKYLSESRDGQRTLQIISDDQTTHELTMGADGKIKFLREGAEHEKNGRLWEFKQEANQNKLVVSLQNQTMLTMSVDEQGHIATFKEGLDKNEEKFVCDAGGRAERITDKSGKISETNFDPVTGLVKNTADSTKGISVEYTYHTDRSSPLFGVKLTSTLRDGNKTATTKFIYNVKRQCVFEISPEGRLKQYLYDDKKPYHLLQTHQLPVFLPNTIEPSITAINQYISTINPENLKQRIISVHGYDSFGRKNRTSILCNDKVVAESESKLDAFGRETQIKTLATTRKKEFDGLDRTVFTSEADHDSAQYNESVYEHHENKTTITQSNGLRTEKYIDTCGQETDTILQADRDKPAREAQIERRTDGSISAINRKDGSSLRNIYSKPGQIKFTLSTRDGITEYLYDENDQQIGTIKYDLIADSKLQSLDDVTAITTHCDRYLKNLIIKDHDGNIRFEITIKKELNDQGIQQWVGSVTEHQYQLGRRTATIQLATKLTKEQFDQRDFSDLKTDKDRVTQRVYDLDGNLLAEWVKASDDEKGYYKLYEYNALGLRVGEKVLLDKLPFNANLNLENIRSLNTRHWYDNAGRKIATLDADNYLTAYFYNDKNQLAVKRIYANPLQGVNHLSINIDIPPFNKETDQAYLYGYDDLGREASIEDTQSGLLTTKEYQNNDLLVIETKTDKLTGEKRITQKQFNAFNELIAEASARVSASMQSKVDKSNWVNKIYHPITGLLLQEIDAQKNKTVYLYGSNRKPLLAINALGEVVRFEYDGLTGKPTLVYAYYNKMNPDILKKLQDDIFRSGLYDEASLKDVLPSVNGNDRKESFSFNSDGTLNCHIKANGGHDYQFNNSFSEIEKTKTEVEKDKYLETKLEHDLRGNVTKEIIDPNGAAITTATKHDDALNRVTEKTTASEHTETVVYEGLRKCTMQDTEDESRKKTLTQDAFMRPESETDWQGKNASKHLYNNQERKHTLVSPVSSDRNISESTNAFGEMTETEVAGRKKTINREVDGQTSSIINPDGSSESNGFDISGYNTSKTSLLGLTTQLKNDAIGRLKEQKIEIDKKEFITSFDPNPFGDLKKMTDPTGLIVDHIKSDELTDTEVTDLAGLFLVKQRRSNLAGQLASLTHGDKKDIALYREIYERDLVGNEIGRKIDLGDNQYAIIHETKFDKSGHAIQITNGKGETTYHVYDKRGNQRYTIDQMGFVIEQIFDANNHVIREIKYAIAINPVDINKLDKLLTKDNLDLATHYLRDGDGLVRFELRGSAVIEYRYNGAKERIDTIEYATEIAIDNPTLESVAQLITGEPYANHPLNRCLHIDYDVMGRPRLERDPTGSETLFRYDTGGNEVARIKNNERATYRIYDRFGNLRYKIDAEGYIKERRYNDAHVCTDKLAYAKKLNDIFTTDDISQLTQLLNQEGVDRQSDLILKDLEAKIAKLAAPEHDLHMVRILDAAHRIKGNTDSEGNTESYTLDGLGRVNERKDNRGNLWINNYSKINKLTHEISPEIEMALVSKDEVTGQLKSTTLTEKVISEFKYDDAFNQNETVLASNIPSEKRSQKTLHDKKQLVEGTTIENATFAKDGVATKGNIDTHILRDYAGRPLIETAANSGKDFTVYDQRGRKRFSVDAEGYVTEYRYQHAFNEPSEVIHYHEPMDIAALTARHTGLTLPEMAEFVQKESQHKLNRSIAFTYNHNGQQLTAKRSKAYAARVYWENGKRFLVVKEFERLVTFQYNKFGEIIAEVKSRMDGKQDSTLRRFYDKNGNEIATLTANGYLTLRTYGMHNCRKDGDHYLEESSIQYFNPIPMDKRGSLDDILSARTPDPINDRRMSRTFDRRHLCIKTTFADGHPFFDTYREADRSLKSRQENCEITTETQYDANGEPAILTDAMGEKSYLIRNAAGDIVWEIGFPVEIKEGVKATPVRKFLYNAHRQPVGSIIYYQPGKIEPDNENNIKLDNLVTASTLDKVTLTLMCNRGLPLLTQENASFKESLFNESRLPVSSKRFVTVPDKNDLLTILLKKVAREKSWAYNLRNDVTMEARKDEFDDLETHFLINAFRERTAEGPAKGDWRLLHRFDNVGNKWFTDSDQAIGTINFFDEVDGELVSVRSMLNDLHELALMENGYEKAKELLADLDYELTFEKYQQWVSYRNDDGQLERQDTPWYRSRPKLEPENYDVTFTVVKDTRPGKTGYLLRFSPPDEAFLQMSFKLREKGKEWRSINIEMPKENGTEFCFIPLGDLPSNPYEYCLDFHMQNAKGEVSRLPNYRASGEVMLDTGNYTASTKPIYYMENSHTLVIAGAAPNICGIELMKDGQPAKRIAAIKGSDGKLRVNLENEGQGTFDFSYITAEKTLAENITLGNSGPFSLGLYRPAFIMNDYRSLQLVPGTLPPELSALTYDVQRANIPLINCDPPPPRTKDGRSYRVNIFAFLPNGEKFDIGSVFISDNMIHDTGNKPIAYCKPILRVVSNDVLPDSMALNVDQALSKVAFKAATQHSGLVTLQAGDVRAVHTTLYGLLPPANPEIAGQVTLQNEASLFVPLEIAVSKLDAHKTTFVVANANSKEFYPKQTGLHFTWLTTLDKPHHLTMINDSGTAEMVNHDPLPMSKPDNIPMYYHQAIPRDYDPDKISVCIQTEEGDRIPLCYNIHPAITRDPVPPCKTERFTMPADNHIFVMHRKQNGFPYTHGFVKSHAHYAYPPSNIIYIKHLPAGTDNVVFEYTFTTSLGEKVWRQAECHLTSKGGLSIFTNNIPAGNYQCRILCKEGSKVIPVAEPGFKQDQQGYCYLNINITKKEATYGQVFSNKKREKALKIVKPHREMKTDRWGNKRSDTDRKNNTLTSDFNQLNQPLKTTTPPLKSVNKDGTESTAPLSTENRMNKRGHLVEAVDEGGDSRKHLVNQKGENLCVEDADGVQNQHEFDLFSNCLASRAAAFGLIRSSFERINGLLVETRTYPNASTEIITYNEEGHPIKILGRAARKDRDTEATFLHPDEQNRHRLTINPLSRKPGTKQRTTTQKAFHPRSGAQTLEVNEDKRQQTWDSETGNAADKYVGNITRHTDLAGQVIVFDLNFNKQVLKECGTVDAEANKVRGNADNGMTAPPPRNLRYVRDEAGRETDIIDDGAQLTTRKRYNKEDYSKEYYFIGHDGHVYQATNTKYDQLHRIHEICDTRILLEFGYDKKSKRRYAKASMMDAKGEQHAYHSWYDYTSAGRVSFRDCVLEDLQIKLKNGRGMKVTYEDGRVATQESITADGKAQSIQPQYGVGSAITGVVTKTQGEPDKVETRVPDSADRLMSRTVTTKDKTIIETFTLDLDGSILSQVTDIKPKDKDQKHSTVTRTIKEKSDLKLVETVVTKVFDVIKGINLIVTDEVTTHYTAADNLSPSDVTCERISATTEGKNPDGAKIDIEAESNKIKKARVVTRVNANGSIVGIGPDAPVDKGTFPDGYREFVVNSENCYLSKETKDGRNYYFYAQKRPGKTTLMAYFGDVPDDTEKLAASILPKVINIDVNHQSLSANFPPPYPGKCTADGLKSYREIAEDLNYTGYAEAIAWANNADTDSIPPAGTEIKIPTLMTEVAETATNGTLPAIEMLLGSMYPALAMPHISVRPPKINWALLVLEMAAAAAVTYFTAGALSGAVAGALGNALAYGAAGMAGSLTSQGIAMAAHQQQGLNVKAMATQTVAMAVSGGMLNGGNGATTAATPTAQSFSLGDLAMNIATTEAVNAAQQVALMAAGLQSKPDRKSFATALFNSAAGTAIKAGFGDNILASGVYTGVSQVGDSLIRGQSLNGTVISANVVGSMLGSYAGQQGLSYLESKPPQATAVPAHHSQAPGKNSSIKRNAPAKPAKAPPPKARPENNWAADQYRRSHEYGYARNKAVFWQSRKNAVAGPASTTPLSQTIKDGYMEAKGFLYGAFDSLTFPIRHPQITLEGIRDIAFNAGVLAFDADYDGSAAEYFRNIGKGASSLIDQTHSADPYASGEALGNIFASVATIPLGGEGVTGIGGMLGRTASKGLSLFKKPFVPKSVMTDILSINASTPSEIAWGYGKLSNRQSNLLGLLEEPGQFIQIHKSGINLTDLAALTAYTGDEFALFTLGSRRIIVRGNSERMIINQNLNKKLLTEDWSWSAHTHPGLSDKFLMSSGGDRQTLQLLNQKQSVILNSAGRRSIFDMSNDYAITDQTQLTLRMGYNL